MTTVALAAPVAAAPLSTACVRAQALGLPATLFGFTPEQPEYWHEPGLPSLTARQMNFIDDMPLDYRGNQALLCVGQLETNSMAPRFPEGCAVQSAPVWDKANLAIGRVYIYCYREGSASAWRYEIGRLVKIGGNYLEVTVDNPRPDAADRTIWLLGEEPGKEVWDVREITHYVSYPGKGDAHE
ncbi:MAG: hypothetical protein ACRYFZ_26435 [Janthinobacterium lividum]